MAARSASVGRAGAAALVYLAFSVLWIWGSDAVLSDTGLGLTVERITFFASIKGTVFVSLSAALVYVLIRWSQRRVAEEERAVRAVMEQMREAADTAGEIVWTFDTTTGEARRHGNALERIWGRAEGAINASPDTFIKWIHPDDRDRVATAFATAREGRTVEQEYRVVHPDGSIRWIWDRAAPILDGEGRVIRVVGVARDVTERVDSDLLRRSVFDNMLEGFVHCVAVEREGEIVDFTVETANPAFSRLTGLKTPVGRSASALLPELKTSDPDLFSGLVRAARGGPPERFEAEVTELGTWLLVSALNSGPGRFVAVLEDITELKRKELALEEARRAVRAASEAKSRFIATMSHELRTPLNAVLGFVDLVETETFGPIGDPRYREYAADARQGGRHLLSLINDILDLSKIESGKMSLEPRALSVPGLIDAGVRLFTRSARERGLTLITRVPRDLPPIHADERAARQIIINLLSNAVKFTDEGGRIEISATVDGDAVSIVVMDTGIGIPPDQLERALLPFEQVENHYGRAREGTGLGLSIVQGLVSLHDGRLEIASEPGRGTTVTVRLKAAA